METPSSRKSTRRFPTSLSWTSYVAPKPLQRAAQKRKMAIYHLKLHFTWKKSAVKVSFVWMMSATNLQDVHWPIYPCNNGSRGTSPTTRKLKIDLLMSAKYPLPVIYDQNCPTQQSHGLLRQLRLSVHLWWNQLASWLIYAKPLRYPFRAFIEYICGCVLFQDVTIREIRGRWGARFSYSPWKMLK